VSYDQQPADAESEVRRLRAESEERGSILRALLDEVSYVSKGPAHRAALEWRERNRGK